MEELPLTLRLVGLFLLLAVNSFFAAAEVALVSVRKTRMRQLAEAGDRRAEWALALLASPDRMLSATQLGVTLASLGLGWAGESTVLRLAGPLFRPLIESGFAETAHALAFALSFGVITFFHMVLGEVVPKNLALERAERLALAVARPLELFARASGLFVSLVRGTAEKLSRLLGLKMTAAEKAYSPDELKLVLSIGRKEGEGGQPRQEMLHRAIDFFELTVREVMVPRQELTALPVDAGLDQVLELVTRRRHSRIPVYEGSPEHVVGVCYVKEIWSFVETMRRRQAPDRPPPFLLTAFTHGVEFVPETKLLHELLEEFQEEGRHMAMVVDEFGTVSGLVTLEDAVEQIVGEIRDEHEDPVETRFQEGPIEIDGNTNILDLGNHYGIELPYDAGFETLAGFLLSRLGHLPEAGEQVEYENRRFTVVRRERNRIARVRIEEAPASAANSPDV